MRERRSIKDKRSLKESSTKDRSVKVSRKTVRYMSESEQLRKVDVRYLKTNRTN